MFADSAHGRVLLDYEAVRCPNPSCKQVTLAASIKKFSGPMGPGAISLGETVKFWSLLPESSAKPQPSYIPNPIVEDYREACLILNTSPKAAATLARRCLQGMIRDFWGINKRTLFDEIAALEGKVSMEDWDAIDAVRHFGNIGAHMEKDVNVIVPVDEKEVALLVGLIEQLFLDWYVNRHDRKERSAHIVRLSKEKKGLAKGEAVVATQNPEAASVDKAE